MRKRALPILLVICVLILLLTTGTSASGDSIKDIVQAYKQMINQTSLYKYAYDNAVSLCDLDGDTVPELFLCAARDDTTAVDIKIWTYLDGRMSQVRSLISYLASSSYCLYLNSSGKLVYESRTFGYNTLWISLNTYSCEDRNLTVTETVGITVEYEENGDMVNWDRYQVSCTVNDRPVSESEAKTRYAALDNDRKTVIISDLPETKTLAMSKSDAINYLDGIDSFFDVPFGQYYAEPVKWAVQEGITNGTGAYAFSPDKTCTRAQILTFLWRALGSPTSSSENPFTDVKSGDYYYQAALWAAENGMVSGNRFEGSTPCTRASTVTYLWQYAGSPDAAKSSFSDVSASSGYSKAVSWAVENGITNGTGNNRFSPDEICSRGQIVTFLYRARNIKAVGRGGSTDPADGKNLKIEQPYVILLKEIQNAISKGDTSGVSENAQEYFDCKQWDSGQGGSDLKTTLFALVDLDENGTQELLLSTSEGNLDTLYTIRNGAVTVVASFAYRDVASVHGDVILNWGSAGASYGYTSFLKLEKNGSKLYSLEEITIDYNNDQPVYDSSSRGSITEEEYMATVEKYSSQSEPTWHTLLGFSF